MARLIMQELKMYAIIGILNRSFFADQKSSVYWDKRFIKSKSKDVIEHGFRQLINLVALVRSPDNSLESLQHEGYVQSCGFQCKNE